MKNFVITLFGAVIAGIIVLFVEYNCFNKEGYNCFNNSSPTNNGKASNHQQPDSSEPQVAPVVIEPEMVVVPAGRFRMGDIQGGGNNDEQPVHWVSLSSFAIGRYEVTFAEYDQFAQATGRELPNDVGWGRGRRPVINVSWRDAVAYAEWLSQQN